MEVELVGLVEPVVALLVIVVSFLTGWFIKWGAKKVGIAADAEVLIMLDTVAQRGISLAANRLKEAGSEIHSVEVKNELLAMAANYVVAQAPDLIKSANIEDKLEDYLESLLVERLDITTEHMVVDTTATEG